MTKIAVFQNRPGIGDMCLFLPMIHSISKYYSEKIHLFTKSRSKSTELLKYDPYVKDISYTDKELETKNFLSKVLFLKKLKFDQVYIFSYGLKYPLLFKLSGVQKIYYYGFLKKNNNIFLDAKELLNKSLGKRNYTINCKLFLKDEPILQNKSSCVIGIGGSGPTKKWPIKNYQILINELKFKGFKTFIIAGGKNELTDFNKLKETFPELNLISLCKKSIDESINQISKSSMYIGNDTGFMHISGLCGLQTYGLFGDTPTNYVSYNPMIKTIIPEGYSDIGHNSRAIEKITVKKVLQDLNL